MRISFVISSIYLSEPLGALLLISLCRKQGHQVRLIDLSRKDFVSDVKAFEPDVVAYSTMSADLHHFEEMDLWLREYIQASGKKIFRLMGGPHPTYSPQVFDQFQLDAICQGDGDRAFPELLQRLESGSSLEGIKNIGLSSAGAVEKELFAELDELPYIDRDEIYRLSPYYREAGLRSFQAGRGCPYSCSYCFNSAYNQMYKGCGPLLRRHSVDHLLADIKHTIEHYSPVRFIRFADDVFAFKADDWIKEFAERYPKEIGIPFYCLLRPNNFTEDMVEYLAKAGCSAVAMSVETGLEDVRRGVINRYISDKTMKAAFDRARAYGIATYGNCIIGIPGTTLEQDFQALEFTRSMKLTAPTFSICCPYPGTKLWDVSREMGLIDEGEDVSQNYMDLSVLNCYTDKEKAVQSRISNLGTLYCTLPAPMASLVRKMMTSNLSVKFCHNLGRTYMQYRVATRIFPRIIPRTAKALYYVISDSLKTWKPVKNTGP
ncbi:MAG: radical SAM protein [bacterium]|nr:radical SAM protein [bacterium]